ncbi:hypothetical protein LCM20_03820 [Halobacillus litoralis]|uniref:hypothetical protein n=1 Tax=Halobacillus litoralis TaxID=45668 RepID=UPI001CD1B315|nr:hypothetical protein [Halobacillus litoralis]MCA0969721.1 hypothetical protein [Halobacillus litoralis]
MKKRVIKDNRQHYLEEMASLELTADQVNTPTETIPLSELHDVSHRSLAGEHGFLYLHTIRGVRTFLVEESPVEWMTEVKRWL